MGRDLAPKEIEMRLTFTAGLGVVALAAVAGAATAQTPPAPPAAAMAAPHHARHAPAAPQTRAAYVDARVARLTALDANHDGVVSVEERRAGQAAHRASWIDARFAKMDANGDGMISRAEFDAAAAAQTQRGARMGWHGRPGAERQAGPIAISDVAAKLGQRFDAMDSNRDGVISPEERRAARAAHRAERPGRRAPRPAAPQAASPAPTSE